MGLTGLLHAAMWCGRAFGMQASPPLLNAQYVSLSRRLFERRNLRLTASIKPPMVRGAVSASAVPKQAPLADLWPRFQWVLQEDRLISRGAIVLVLVSGGRDSVALLRLLAQARTALELDLHVLHFNHRTRDECDEEETFVRGLASACAAEFHVRHLQSVPATGLQARTRNWRRTEALDLLARLVRPDRPAHEGAQQREAQGPSTAGTSAVTPRDAVIALGHHADDDTETILLKWLRGAHITRLSGMRARDGPFVRPLLRFGKEELTRWMVASGFEWREDSSNAEASYKRNQVRLQLVPLLQQLTGGSLSARLSDLVAQGREARELLELELGGEAERQALQPDEEGRLNLPALLALPSALQTEALHRYLQARTGRPSDYAEVRRVLAQLGSENAQLEVHLAAGWVLHRTGARVHVRQRAAADAGVAEPWRTAHAPRPSGELSLSASASCDAAHAAVQVAHPVDCEVLLHSLSGSTDDVSADGTALGGECGEGPAITLYNVPPGSRLHVRTRRNGDEFAPAWRERALKLKDFLRGQKVPLHERDRLRLITCELPQVTGEQGRSASLSSGASVGDGRREQVLAVYPSHVSRFCSRDEGIHAPIRIAIIPTRAPPGGE